MRYFIFFSLRWTAHSEGLIKASLFHACLFYMITFLALIVVWDIFLDMRATIWDDETSKAQSELEECDKKLLQMKINSLEAQYKRGLKAERLYMI